MTHRDYDGTKNCGGCRYWSELCAQSIGCGPIEALCLGDGPHKGRMTTRNQHCDGWAIGNLGAIDTPGFRGNEYNTASHPDDN